MELNNKQLNYSILKENVIIPKFDTNNDFTKYFTLVNEDFKKVRQFFPLMKLSMLPTNEPQEIFISGKLIPYEVLKICGSEMDIGRNSISVMAIYPSDFNKSNICVKDVDGKIDWNKIPQEHRHYRYYKNLEIICTHHELGEINGIPNSERSIAILYSAWRLFIHYIKYQKTGKWTLKDLKHDGVGAIGQLKRLGQYYGC